LDMWLSRWLLFHFKVLICGEGDSKWLACSVNIGWTVHDDDDDDDDNDHHHHHHHHPDYPVKFVCDIVI